MMDSVHEEFSIRNRKSTQKRQTSRNQPKVDSDEVDNSHDDKPAFSRSELGSESNGYASQQDQQSDSNNKLYRSENRSSDDSCSNFTAGDTNNNNDDTKSSGSQLGAGSFSQSATTTPVSGLDDREQLFNTSAKSSNHNRSGGRRRLGSQSGWLADCDSNHSADSVDSDNNGDLLHCIGTESGDSHKDHHLGADHLEPYKQGLNKPSSFRSRRSSRPKQQEKLMELQREQERTTKSACNQSTPLETVDGSIFIRTNSRRRSEYDSSRRQNHLLNSSLTDIGSFLRNSIHFFSTHLLPQQPSKNVKQTQSVNTGTKDHHSIHDKQTHDHCQEMPSGNNRYQTFQAADELDDDDDRSRYSAPSRKISKETFRLAPPNRRYSKLNHHHHHFRTSRTPSIFQELKRVLLLLLIITGSCILLWQLYEVLIDEYNYLGKVKSPSELGKFSQYAVSTDAKSCAEVGSRLLAKGGSAVDAAIGTLLCMGVVIPNSLGLGGGCLMTIYDRKSKKATVIDGREVAPDYAFEEMFAGNALSASRGPLSIGIPGELAAYWKAHQKFGKLKWSELFGDTIAKAENGAPVVEHFAYALRATSHAQYITPLLAKLYTNNETGKYYDEGEVMVQKALAETLRRLRDNGASEFYGGLTGQLFVKDLKEQGGNITLENMVKYEALEKEPLVVKLDENLTLYTQPPPGSGVVLSIILRIMKELGYYKNLKPQESFLGASLYYHRLVESYKFAYAERAGLEDKPDDPVRMEKLMSKLLSEAYIKGVAGKIDNKTHSSDYYGSVDYFKEDHGTAHVSVIDSEGNAAAVTSSVNLYFGSGLLSPSTGIVYNDVMDDFVSPNLINKFNLAPSNYNRIRAGKRPLSSMAPSIFTDANGDVKLVIGGSGGSKITTAIGSVVLRNLFIGEDIKTAIDGPRLHHQFLPNNISYESNFPKDLLHSLVERGHVIQPILSRSSVMIGLARDLVRNNSVQITANSDYRKGGSVAGF